ncbi:MAG: DNA-binding protein [Hydrogenophaga sp.]|nr:DNA-binding protein [Hydrogenophaga sp.]
MEDVWSAADLVLNAGQRPTIERVRAQLGRGSPNTVAPMLDAWFASLGKRLSGADKMTSATPEQESEEMPAPVLRAARTLWGRARSYAAEVEHLAAQKTREALEMKAVEMQNAQLALEDERRQLSLKTEALAATLEAKNQQITLFVSQLREVQQELSSSRHEVTRLKGLTDQMRGALDTARLRIDDLNEQNRKDRQQIEDRSVAQEHRLLEELDRVRQELKRTKLAATEEKRRSNASHADLTEKIGVLKLQLEQEAAQRTHLEAQLISTQAAVMAAESHVEKLEHEAAKKLPAPSVKINKGLATPRGLNPRVGKFIAARKMSRKMT